ncbi:MAG: butyrate kinase [Bacteroidales bacterium]|nr:butyrate kinase [Bacteroidales bacterium]
MDSNYPAGTPMVLALNPRIPFTHIGVFHQRKMVFLTKINHSEEELQPFETYADQTIFRSERILQELEKNDIDISHIGLVISRGGLIEPVKPGIYKVNEKMIKDLQSGVSGNDVVNLGGLIAAEIASRITGAYACVAEPVVVDEFDDLARVTGHPEIRRRSVFHALEQKTVARKYAQIIQKKYEEMNLLIAHLGNGITVGAHHLGRVIDANQGFDGDGPFSPSRTGTLPAGDLVRLCFSGKYTKKEILELITIKGGLYAYLSTADGYAADQNARQGDHEAQFILKAMGYQVAKTIGSMSTVLHGKVDAILLTGGMTNSHFVMDELVPRVESIAPVHIFPDQDDVETLAVNGFSLLNGETQALDY